MSTPELSRTLDPAEVMSDHHPDGVGCAACWCDWPCDAYRMAESVNTATAIIGVMRRALKRRLELLESERAKVRYYKREMISARRRAESQCNALPHEGPCHYSHLLGDD